MKRFIAILLSVSAALSLCACGSIYDTDYLVIEDYITEQSTQSESGSVTVSRYSGLKNSILELVLSGSTEGSIVLDVNYNGDPAEDLARACWELRSQNALCAYCVENIAYELSQIVTYYEAKVNVSYAENIDVSDVQRVSYAYELREIIREAMLEGREKLAVLVGSGYYSSEDVTGIIGDIYYAVPSVSTVKTSADVTVYSGSGGQKLYEINIDYGTDMETINSAKQRLAQLQPFEGMDIENMSEGRKALAACEYLSRSCLVTASHMSSAYDALLDGLADSEGIALAYVELCRELGISCRIVQGQYNWNEHFWNIVEIDGERYHVDVTSCISGELSSGFLFNDSEFWGMYRWDIASYPSCSGELTYKEISES